MTSINRDIRPLIALGLGILGVIPGCGDGIDSLPTVPASGTVTYQGKPLESGTIQFTPGKGRPAGGKIEGGRFTLTTYKDGDGAIPGKHTVAVSSMKEKPPDNPGGEREMIPAIDKKYFTPEQSGLTAEVPAKGSTDIKIDIP